jgi:hypothetical protein
LGAGTGTHRRCRRCEGVGYRQRQAGNSHPGVIYDKEIAGVCGLGGLAGKMTRRSIDLKPRRDRAQIKRHRPVVSRGAVRAAQNGPAAGSGVVVKTDDVCRVCLRDSEPRDRSDGQYRNGRLPVLLDKPRLTSVTRATGEGKSLLRWPFAYCICISILDAGC